MYYHWNFNMFTSIPLKLVGDAKKTLWSWQFFKCFCAIYVHNHQSVILQLSDWFWRIFPLDKISPVILSLGVVHCLEENCEYATFRKLAILVSIRSLSMALKIDYLITLTLLDLKLSRMFLPAKLLPDITPEWFSL